MGHSSLPLSLASVLKLDAATCAVMGALLMLADDPVSQFTRIPEPLLYWAGMALFPVAAFIAIWAFAQSVPGWALFAVVAGNILWVVASLALPLFGFVGPNGFGWMFLVGQAAVVAGFAWLESAAGQHLKEAV